MRNNHAKHTHWKPWEQSTGPRIPQGNALVSCNAWRGGRRQQLRESSKSLNAELAALSQEYDRAWVGNSQQIYNSAFTHYVEVGNIIQLARSAALAALHREESRGAHTRKDFTKRNDEKFLQHSLVHVKNDQFELSYRPVVMGKYQPEVRKY